MLDSEAWFPILSPEAGKKMAHRNICLSGFASYYRPIELFAQAQRDLEII